MLDLLKISEASNIAIHSLVFLTSQKPGSSHSVSEISRELKVSSAHLHKVLQRLVKARLLKSNRGITGGYAFLKSPKDISLFEIIKNVEGPLIPNDCLLEKPICERGSCAFKRLSTQVERFFKNTKLVDFKVKKTRK